MSGFFHESSFHGKALRRGRHSAPGNIYIVTIVTKQRHFWFQRFDSARVVVRALLNSDRQGFSSTYAFVVMPDHLHWLVQLENKEPLSRVVQRVKSEVTRGLRQQETNIHNQVWQAGFHDHAMRNEESLIRAARYIVANPLRAGLCRSVREYPHWDCVWV